MNQNQNHSHDDEKSIDRQVLQKLKQMPLEPAPFSPDWLNTEPKVTLAEDTILGRSSSAAGIRNRIFLLSAAASVILAITGFLYTNQKSLPGTPQLPAIVIFRQGEVSVTGNDKAILPGFRLQSNDTVQIAENSRLDLQLPDHSLVRIKGQAEIRLISSSEKKIAIEQRIGSSYHYVAQSEHRDDYQITTPTAIASVRGTQFKVNSTSNSTSITVSNGKVQAENLFHGTSAIVEKAETAEITANNEVVEKKHANITDDIVTFNEMQDQQRVWNPNVMNEMKSIEPTSDAKTIEKLYQRQLEILYMTDGQVLKGVVASQVDRTLILHTTEGVVAIPIENLKEVRFSSDHETELQTDSTR